MNQTALVVSNSKIRKTYYIYNSGKWNLYFISCYTTMGRFPWRIIIINRRGWVLLSVWSRTTLKEKPEYNNKSYKFQNKFQKKNRWQTQQCPVHSLRSWETTVHLQWLGGGSRVLYRWGFTPPLHTIPSTTQTLLVKTNKKFHLFLFKVVLVTLMTHCPPPPLSFLFFMFTQLAQH